MTTTWTSRTFWLVSRRTLTLPLRSADWSIKDPSADWKEKALYRIRHADQVIVICGQHTGSAVGVNVELRLAAR